MLETDTDFLALVADIANVADPFTELQRMSRVCPADVRVALIGESTEISFYRVLMELGVSEYLPKPLTRDMVQTQLRPKLFGDAAPNPTERGGHVISICGAQGGAGPPASPSISLCNWPRRPRPRSRCLTLIFRAAKPPSCWAFGPARIAHRIGKPGRGRDTLFLERGDRNQRARSADFGGRRPGCDPATSRKPA